MLERFTTSLRIRVWRHRICVQEQHRWRRVTLRTLANRAWPESDFDTPDACIQRLEKILAKLAIDSRIADIQLGDDLVRYFTVTPPGNASRLADCQAAAAMRFQFLYGEPSAEWQVSAEWDTRAPFLACAVPLALCDGLLGAAALHKLKILRIAPQFVANWNTWQHRLAPDAWFGLVSGRCLTIGVIHASTLHAVRSTRLPAAPWNKNALLEHVKREALMLGVPIPQRLQLYGKPLIDWATSRNSLLAVERIDATTQAPLSTGERG